MITAHRQEARDARATVEAIERDIQVRLLGAGCSPRELAELWHESGREFDLLVTAAARRKLAADLAAGCLVLSWN